MCVCIRKVVEWKTWIVVLAGDVLSGTQEVGVTCSEGYAFRFLLQTIPRGRGKERGESTQVTVERGLGRKIEGTSCCRGAFRGSKVSADRC